MNIQDESEMFNLDTLIQDQDETKYLDNATEIPVWMPKNYNNEIVDTVCGKHKFYPGVISFKLNTKFNSSLWWGNESSQLKLKLTSKNKNDLSLSCNDKDITIVKTDNADTNEYEITYSKNDITLLVMITEEDTIEWELSLEKFDNKTVKLNVNYKPDILQILQSKIKTINQYELETEELNGITKTLNIQLEDIIKNSKDAFLKLKDEQKKNSKLEKRLDNYNKVILKLQVNHNKDNEAIKFLKEDNKLLKNSVDTRTRVSSRLQNEKLELMQKNKELIDENNIIKTSIDKYRNENNTIVKKNKENSLRIDELVKENTILQSKLKLEQKNYLNSIYNHDLIEKKLKELEKKNEKLIQEDNARTNEIESLNDTIEKRDDLIEKLRDDLDDLTCEKLDLNDELFDLKIDLSQEIWELNKELGEKSEENQELLSKLDKKDETTNNFIVDLAKKNRELTDENEMLKKDYDYVNEINVSLKKDLKENESKLAKCKQSMVNLEETNKYLHNNIKNHYELEISKLRDSVHKMNEQNVELNEKKAALELDLIDLKLKNTELVLKIESIEKKLTKCDNNSKKDLADKIYEIFDWYTDSVYLDEEDKRMYNYTKSLEDEILTVLKEFMSSS